MGQYYTPVVTQGNETILFGNRTAIITDADREDQKKYGEFSNYHGLKITEHSWWENALVKGVIGRLYNKKGRVAWVGDYTDGIMDEVVSNDGTKAPMSPDELYSGCVFARTPNGEFARTKEGYKIELENEPLPKGVKKYKGLVKYNPNFTLNGKIVINLTRKEYINCDAYYKRSVTDDGWCLNPVPLLTSTGGDQGGGDYHSSHIDAHQVGRWAYDELIIKDFTPARVAKLEKDGFTVLNVTFNEEMENFVAGVV